MIRPPRDEDVDAIVALLHACGLHDLGPEHADAPESIRPDLIASWRRHGFDPATDAWVAVEGGEVTGYADVHVRPNGEAVSGGDVHPARRGRGLGTQLVERFEARARATLTTIVSGTNPSADESFLARGYRAGFRSWQMTIALHEPPTPPDWPAAVTVRTLRRGDERALHELIDTAFLDQSPDREPLPFEDWAALMFRDDTDPSLYFLAERQGELVGAVLCPWYPDIGWIRQIAVRRDQRGQGLGLALLRHAFGALHERGHHRVGLGTDEWNETGARRLFERAGMRATLEHRRYHR